MQNHRCDKCGYEFLHDEGPRPCPMGPCGASPEINEHGLCGGIGRPIASAAPEPEGKVS